MMNRYFKLFFQSIFKLIIGAFLLGSNFLVAQEISFQNFNTKNGLPSTQVYNMHQDSFGVIWFATDRGICNYNGYEFEHFGIEDGLTSNTVFKFYPQKDGNIWCTTFNNRLFYFKPKERVFHPYQFNDALASIVADWDCKDFFIDENKMLHLSFRNIIGFLVIDSSGNVQNNLSKKKNGSLSGIVIESNQKNQSFTYLEEVQIARPTAIGRYRLEMSASLIGYYQGMVKDSLKIISNRDDVYLINKQAINKKISTGKRPITMGFLTENKFWVGYDFGGVVSYNFNGEETLSLLENESVTGVLIDHEGGYWISTLYSGVFYANNLNNKHLILEDNENVHSLAVDENGELLVSLSNGNVYHLTKEGFKLWFKSINQSPTLCQYYPSINRMVYFGNDKMYLDDDGWVVRSKNMPEENGEPIFFPAGNGVFQERKMSEYLAFPFKFRVLDVCAKDDLLLLGTREGVYRYSLSNENCIKVKSEKFNSTVLDIDLFKKETFLLATIGNGVGILNGDSLLMFTTADGLVSNMVKEVYIQNDSTFWLCTNAGVNRVINSENGAYSISSYTTFDGLSDNDINDIEIINDVAWVATSSGLNSFNINEIDQKITVDNCFLQLLGNKVNDRFVSDFSDLDYNQNKLEFSFQAISFKGYNTLNYRYRLVGLDKGWNVTSNLKIIYEAVPPGDYQFELQAGLNGVWIDEHVAVEVHIAPPFYSTLGFISLSVLLVLLIVYLFFRYRILSYNREISREVLRLLLKRLKKGSLDFVVRENGRDVKVNSLEVLYIKSLGNYIEFFTTDSKIVVRNKLSNVKGIVPDPIEYLQIHRSYVVRIDKISKKGANSVFVGDTEIKAGETYRHLLPQIQLA